MEPYFYTETMTVMNADADFRSLLKPSALLRYVEQVSTDHARAYGMDDQFFKDRGVTFLVGKQALKFERVPRRAEKLTLITRAEKSRRGSVKRITTAGSLQVLQKTASCGSRAGRWRGSGMRLWRGSCPCSCTNAARV